MKVVITGANGYIGSRLCQYLAAMSYEVIALCYPEIPNSEIWTKKLYKVICGDISEQKTIEMITKIEADVIIHLVSLDHFESEKNPDYVAKVNLLPTWDLLKECTKLGLKKFIYFSTIHVYGRNLKGDIKENQKPTPHNTYGLTHFICEEICNFYDRQTSTECINIRLSNSYGEPIFEEAKCWDLIINNLALSAYRKQEIRLSSDGTAIRDFIHFSDICSGINQILSTNEKKRKKQTTIHFSSGDSLSMIEVAEIVQHVYQNKFGKIIPIYINNNELYQAKKSINSSKYYISNNFAKSINIYSKKPLNEGIADLFNYLERLSCHQ